MARIRTLKPEFWNDEKLSPLNDTARLCFLGLISMADDCGRLADSEKQVEAFIWPHEERSRDVRESLANLTRIGRIVRGKASSGMPVIQIVNWSKHQKVDHPNTKAALPQIVEVIEHPEIREPVAKVSRKRREPFASHSRTIPVPTTSTSTISPSDENPSEATGQTSWVAALVDVWTDKVGDVTHARLGKALKAIVAKHGMEAVVAAIHIYASNDEGPRTGARRVEYFAAEFVRWHTIAKTPLVDGFGELTARGRRIGASA